MHEVTIIKSGVNIWELQEQLYCNS